MISIAGLDFLFCSLKPLFVLTLLFFPTEYDLALGIHGAAGHATLLHSHRCRDPRGTLFRWPAKG